MACTALQSPHPHLRATFPHFSPTLKMRRREPPCAIAPNLCPAESKWRLHSFRCALPRGADIRPPAVALLATPRAGAIRVLFTRPGPPHGSPVEARCVSRTSRLRKNEYIFAGGASDRRVGDAPRCSRLRAVHICVENGALASARCSFSLLATS